jgi:hypothetical protein
MNDRLSAPSPWDNRALETELRRLCTTMSAARIAAELTSKTGVAISRNAVIGKLNRLGLSRPKPAKVDRRPRPKRLPPPPRPPQPIRYIRPPDAFTAFGEPADMHTVDGCRWPVTHDRPLGVLQCPKGSGLLVLRQAPGAGVAGRPQ